MSEMDAIGYTVFGTFFVVGLGTILIIAAAISIKAFRLHQMGKRAYAFRIAAVLLAALGVTAMSFDNEDVRVMLGLLTTRVGVIAIARFAYHIIEKEHPDSFAPKGEHQGFPWEETERTSAAYSFLINNIWHNVGED